ncbi:hypothetical protein C8F01DRAFT_1105267 [Mycena amicta]|nr:hypothetical protein C8F01DRAFT_1105267 [Mycena amicta]
MSQRPSGQSTGYETADAILRHSKQPTRMKSFDMPSRPYDAAASPPTQRAPMLEYNTDARSNPQNASSDDHSRFHLFPELPDGVTESTESENTHRDDQYAPFFPNRMDMRSDESADTQDAYHGLPLFAPTSGHTTFTYTSEQSTRGADTKLLSGTLDSSMSRGTISLPATVDSISSVNHYPLKNVLAISVVGKQQVTSPATSQQFTCPVEGCGSTFTRAFNLRGHMRAHSEVRPYACDWPNCKKAFARSSDCKRHHAIHTKTQKTNICAGCGKTFGRADALNRHLNSNTQRGAECRQASDQNPQEVKIEQ